MRRRSGFGWLELVIGILLIILGVFTLVNPGFALSGLVALFGIIAIVMGVADIVLYVRVERFTGFGPIVSLISGILSVMSGIMLLVYNTLSGEVRAAISDLAVLKYEVLKKVGDAVGNTQAYQL